MVDWVNAPWFAFDTETTGISPKSDRLVTAAIVESAGGFDDAKAPAGTAPHPIRTWLADPGIPIPESAAAIHGITTEYAREFGRESAEVLDQINEVLAKHMAGGKVLIVFNAAFDLPLLEADSLRHGVRTLRDRLDGEVAPVVDPLVIDRSVNKYRRGKRTLAALAPAFGIALPPDTHQAHIDAQLTLELFAAMLTANPQLQELSAAQLHRYQKEAHSQWAQNFESYLASKGSNSKVSRIWI